MRQDREEGTDVCMDVHLRANFDIKPMTEELQAVTNFPALKQLTHKPFGQFKRRTHFLVILNLPCRETLALRTSARV